MQVWARQRTSIYTHDCLNGYLISAILVFLTVDSGGSIITKSMTTRQIFRVVMNFLVHPSKRKLIFILGIFDHVYSIEAYLYSCSNFQGVGKGFGDSINEEAYNHQRG
jgi:U3 small nucleolar RNA-associated protein 22